jgi:transcriptional regulator with XRE-family HTH domain
MQRLKELRLKLGKTQAEIAKSLGTTQQTYARWEAGKVAPPIAALRDLSIILGSSVDYIVGQGADRPMTTRYYILSDDSDGFWGHLGLLMPGESKTRWYPVTFDVANRVRNRLKSGEDAANWIVAETLNNHALVFRPDEMQRIWLLDDACDGPSDDWRPSGLWNDYNGIPLELYQAMAEWAGDQIEGYDDFERKNSQKLRENALAMIEKAGMLDKPEDLEAFLCNTVVHFVDSKTVSYRVEQDNLSRLAMDLDTGFETRILELSAEGGNFESFYPAARIRLIDVPMIELRAAEQRIVEDLESGDLPSIACNDPD